MISGGWDVIPARGLGTSLDSFPTVLFRLRTARLFWRTCKQLRTWIRTHVLDLTKLDWDTAHAFTGSPIPLRFAREVGSIMSHYAELKGEGAEPEPSYRFSI